MWIVDIQLPLDGSETIPKGLRSIPLKEGATYTLGRSADCDITLNLKKVSRLQTEINVLDDQRLEFSNKGHATWVYGSGKELKGGCNDSLMVNKNTVLKLRSSNWKLKVFKVGDLKVSHLMKTRIPDIDFIEISSELKEVNSIFLNGIFRRIKDPEKWITKLNSRDWEKTGGLSESVIPEVGTDKAVINLDDDTSEDERITTAVTKTNKIDFEIVDIKPFHSQLTNREAKRNKKSQLERMFDEMDDLDDLETYTSQSTQRQKISDIPASTPSMITTLPKTSSPAITSIGNVDINLSRLSLKRSVTPEENTLLLKKAKPSPALDTSNTHLAEVFKRTKQMKIDKIHEDEKLLNSIQKKDSPLNVVKIKKFQVNLQGGANPKVYSNYRMAYGSDPRWENRMNYSKFVKTSNGTEYNPIMDSTIKTVKFKNSNYKSNELQVNLNQNDDIIPDLDSMFGDSTITATSPAQLPGRKRRRETTLFVDSDEDDSQTIDAHESYRNNPSSLDNNKGISSTVTAIQNSSISNHSNFNDSYKINDDDDTPVFKSRRR